MTTRHRVALFILALAIPALAQTAAPAPNLSSPAAALTSAYSALRAGDIPTAKACLTFQSPAQSELFDITYTQLYGPLKLMHAMETKFGEAGGAARKPFANAFLDKSLAALIEKIKTTEITITGNTAAVADKKAAVNPNAENELTGITFTKDSSSGAWKIVASTFNEGSADLPPTQLAFMRALRDATNAAITTTLARLAKNEFKTPDDAYADYQSRLQEATKLAAANATTQPVNKP